MKSTFEKMGGTYTLGADGIYYPNLVSTDEEPHYGKYGMMRKTYLKEHCPAMYSLDVYKRQAMDSWEGSKLNEAKEILAFELTKLVHGEEEAQKAQEAARALFSNGGDSANMPTCEVSEERCV